uniref:c-type cytochrome biogenensis protein n=1 Tax=Chroothece richteriana TaxID=101928 RepID=UPI001FCDBFB5|nr:c-type cytochrome biogenensis protein [Chroothece richteriana]UNJ14213.1 c-type cytochrome biogenensis protein [Chroothece richteriana]
MTISLLSNLKFAIILLLLIAFASGLGTLIEQNQNLDFYKKAYPQEQILFNWQVILFFQLNNIFHANWYLSLIGILGLSLVTCTLKTQYPILKVSRKPLFLTSITQFTNLISKQVSRNTFSYLLKSFSSNNYFIFSKKNYIYCHRGLLSKAAPISIHISLLCLLLGITISSLTGYVSQEMVVTGEIFHIQNLSSYGKLSHFPQNFSGRVNDFYITYDSEGNISQFYSDISILNNHYIEKEHKQISVNHPLKHSNTTIYQTDWNIVGINALLDQKWSIQIPLNKISNNGAILWQGSLMSDQQLYLSFILPDLNAPGNILVYNQENQLISQTQVSDTVTIENHTVQILDIIASTGLQIKQDPGLELVYFGFFSLIVSVLINTASYEEIWLLRTNTSLYIKGKNQKNPVELTKQLLQFLKQFQLKYLS